MTVMISYTRKDWPRVEPVVTFLRQRGLPIWIDKEQIRENHAWRRVLLTTPKRVSAFVPFLTENYANSEMCRMELFLASAADRPILPVMLDECWDALREQEETKSISSLFAVRLAALRAVSLPLTREAFLDRLATAIANRISNRKPPDNNAYVSYPGASGPYATKIRNVLAGGRIRPWVATMDCEIGEDWRKAQIRAMGRSRAHVIVISEDFLRPIAVLQTEVVLAESLGVPTFCVISEELARDSTLHDAVYRRLEGDSAFRRLTERQWYRPESIASTLPEDVGRAVRKRPQVPAPDK